jgi:hypothetical protein
MINNFEDHIIVLTSQFPESFINFEYEGSDPNEWRIQPIRNTDISSGTIYINGFDINDDDASIYALNSTDHQLYVNPAGDPSIAAFHVYCIDYNEQDYNITFNVYYNNLLDTTYDVSILNRPHINSDNVLNSYITSNTLEDDNSSSLILRTNPKLTGNIKLVVDTSDNLYLDTFKISNQLSSKEYRHQAVSGSSLLASDIFDVFNKLPLGEMYKLGKENIYDIATPKTDYIKQYEHDYTYGTRLVVDELYTQNFSVLAPLWIDKKLPDYFAIFKLNELYNDPCTNNLVQQFIIDSSIIETYSIKPTAPLGNYLQNHLDELNDFQYRSPAFLSLSDPAQSDPDPNRWTGMAIDKPIITDRVEIPYAFDKTTSNFTNMNAFITEGFERNNLLCANLINLEYLFNDPNLEDFKMARYFGLYLTDNPIYKIAYYTDTSMGDVIIKSLDGKDSTTFFNSTIFDPSGGSIVTEYKDRIFGLAHAEGITRFNSVDEIDGSTRSKVSDFLSKPDKNIVSAEAVQRSVNPYISLHINTVLQQGEHLRIINKTQNTIWEIYGVDGSILIGDEAWTYVSTVEPSTGYPRIYRNVFSVRGSTIEQAHSIKNAFDAFNDFETLPYDVTVPSDRTNAVSIILNDPSIFADNDFQFQRLTAQTREIPSDNSTPFNTLTTDTDITFYDYFIPVASDFEILTYDSSYGPVDFELHGDRRSITLNFLDTSATKLYSLDKSNLVLFDDIVNLYLSASDGWYKEIKDINISSIAIGDDSTKNTYSHSFIYDPVEPIDASQMFIFTDDDVHLIDDKIMKVYSIYPLNISILGINNIKDLDSTVYDSSTYDSSSNYFYKRDDDVSTYTVIQPAGGSANLIELLAPGSYEIINGTGEIYINDNSSIYNTTPGNHFKFNTFNTSDASILTTTTTTIVFNVLDGSKNYTSILDGETEEDINDYYVDASTKKTLKYGLTIPEVTKWSLLGKDVRGHDMRLILDSSSLDASSNFIPYQDDFVDEISYPVFKYLTGGESAWKSYIYVDLNDSILFINDSSAYERSSVKDFMFNNPRIDVFSKIVQSNKNINKTVTRSTIAYSSTYKNNLSFTISGLSLSLTVIDAARNVLNEKDWDKYKVSFISTPSRNTKNNSPIEVIINENFETVLLIWYQGSDDLNYNRKYSTYFGGKNFLDIGGLTPPNFAAFDTGTSQSILNKSNVKTPFIFKSNFISKQMINMYGESLLGYDSSISSPYAQLNWNYGEFAYSIFNAYNGAEANVSNVLTFSDSWDTFTNVVKYNSFVATINTFSDNSYNWGYEYNSNDNHYVNTTNHLHILKYIISINNISYYVFRGDEIITKGSFPETPISLTINEPRIYTPPDSSNGIATYNGWIKPIFNNILNFNSNETSELINIFEQDFILSNTYINSSNTIPQYWYNDLTTAVTVEDTSTANAINYIENYDPFKSIWDSNYYVLDDVLVPGTNGSGEAPSFFGSKVPQLPNQINIEEWTTISIKTSTNNNKHKLEFNISRAIINLFSINNNFTNNWLGLDNATLNTDKYIRNTVIDYYNISFSKLRIFVWTKPYDGTRVSLINDETFEYDDKRNINGVLNTVKGDYIYTITENDNPNLSYYVTFSMTEK